MDLKNISTSDLRELASRVETEISARQIQEVANVREQIRKIAADAGIQLRDLVNLTVGKRQGQAKGPKVRQMKQKEEANQPS